MKDWIIVGIIVALAVAAVVFAFSSNTVQAHEEDTNLAGVQGSCPGANGGSCPYNNGAGCSATNNCGQAGCPGANGGSCAGGCGMR